MAAAERCTGRTLTWLLQSPAAALGSSPSSAELSPARSSDTAVTELTVVFFSASCARNCAAFLFLSSCRAFSLATFDKKLR